MKLFVILISTLFFAQDLSAEKGVTTYEKEFEETVLPLISSYQELTNLIEEVKEYQVSSQVLAGRLFEEKPNFLSEEFPLIETWVSVECSKLPAQLKEAADLAHNIIDWVFKAAQKYGKKVYDLLHCGTGTPNTILNCIIQDVSDLKSFSDLGLNDLKKFRADVVESAKKLKDQFRKCLSTRAERKPTAPKLGKKPLNFGNL